MSALTAKYGGIPGWGYAVGAVALIGGFVLYKRKSAAASTTAASTTAATPSSSDNEAAYAGTGDSGGQDDSSALASILASQQAATAATQAATPTTAAYTPPVGETEQGSGYYLPSSTAPITSANSQQYQWISSWAAAQPLINGGQTLYYQPTPGIFAPATQNNALIPGLGASTPLFAQVSSSS